MVRAQSPCPMRKSWGNWAGSAYGREFQRDQRNRARLLTEVYAWQQGMTQTETGEVSSGREIKKTSLWGQLSRTGCPEKLCSPHPWRFQDLTGQSPEQPCLISELNLLWAGGWTRDLHWGSFQLERFCDPKEVNPLFKSPQALQSFC